METWKTNEVGDEPVKEPCKHEVTKHVFWNYGMDPETGYIDEGEYEICLICGSYL